MPDESVKLCECGCGEPAPLAKITRRTRGQIAGQPIRFCHGHNGRIHPPEWAEEDRGYITPCLIWQGGLHPDGYGRARMRGGYRTTAHRQAWLDAYGPIPYGLFVCHHCDVRACGRLDHLFLGTHAENMADMAAKDRARPNYGEAHHNAKLTYAAVADIRSSPEPHRVLAERYGVDTSLVSMVRRGKGWTR